MALSLVLGANQNVVNGTWTDVKAIVSSKVLALQYTSNPGVYNIFAFDDSLVYTCTIWTGTVPPTVVAGGYSQSQNDTDKTDFQNNYQPYANMPLTVGDFSDPRLIRRLGNLTSTSISEQLISTRPYTEQSSEAQRSVKSSSNNDKTSSSGAGVVRIEYLTSNYIRKTEDVTLNGTTRVSTVNTDIRFIDNFYVIQGAAAVGAISLLDSASGAQNEFCGIAAATTDAFLCHHYVPAGKRAWIYQWGATTDAQVRFKLWGQYRVDGTNLVDRILDLEDLVNASVASPGTRSYFDRKLSGVVIPEKTYVRITGVPTSTSSTVTRARLTLWEVPT
jgi:hypothetical protein